MKTPTVLVLGILTGFSAFAETINFVEPAKPYDNSPAFKSRRGKFDTGRPLLVPALTWAADGIVMDLNQGLSPKNDSPLAKAIGRPVEIKIENRVDNQVADLISGKSVIFRGTSGQISLISGALKKFDPNLELITFVQLSNSTGADAFVSKNLNNLTELKGKTIITQLYGPHPELIANILRDAGLSALDVNLKYVLDITNPAWKPGAPVTDPANAFRFERDATGVTVIDVDALGLTGGKVGTGRDGTVADAKTTFSTKTAPNIIFDCYAVTKEFLLAHPETVEAFRKAVLGAEEDWLKSLDGLARKSKEEKTKLRERARPLAKIIMDDANLVNDYLLWLSEGSRLAGNNGNKDFFSTSNPNGFQASTQRVQEFYKMLGMISEVTPLIANAPFADNSPKAAATPAKKAFASEMAVRQAAESASATVLYPYTFQFSPQDANVRWQDYQDTFKKIYEIYTRYGGAIVQVRGHGDNFFYKFVQAKKSKGDTTFQRKDKVTGQFLPPEPLPDPVQILNDSNALSYTRAFNVKAAFAAYVKDNFGLSPSEIDLSRFDIKGMGISKPAVETPKSAEDRAKNMRCEILVIAAESELPSNLSSDDLQ